MKTTKLFLSLLALLALGSMLGCSASAKSPDVSDSIRKSLDQAGLKSVSVSQDLDKGIVTLSGQVTSENDKSQAESLAKSFAGTQVVADQIAVVPVGVEKETKAMNSDLDQGIEKNREIRSEECRRHTDRRSELGRNALARRDRGGCGAECSASRERSTGQEPKSQFNAVKRAVEFWP
jgi:hypothetical protein